MQKTIFIAGIVCLLLFIASIIWLIVKFKKSKYYRVILRKIDGMLTEKGSQRGKRAVWSSRRFAYLFPIILSNFIIWGCFIFLSFLNNKMPDIPEMVVWLYATANGVPVAGLTYYKKFEKEGANEKISKRKSK